MMKKIVAGAALFATYNLLAGCANAPAKPEAKQEAVVAPVVSAEDSRVEAARTYAKLAKELIASGQSYEQLAKLADSEARNPSHGVLSTSIILYMLAENNPAVAKALQQHLDNYGLTLQRLEKTMENAPKLAAVTKDNLRIYELPNGKAGFKIKKAAPVSSDEALKSTAEPITP